MLKILLKTYRAAFTEDDEINQNFTSSVNYFYYSPIKIFKKSHGD